MPKKVLYIASSIAHLLHFHMPYIKSLEKMGYEVHIAGKFKNENIDGYKTFNINFQKNIFSIKNLSSIFVIRKILTQNYHIISVHTTLAAFVTRLAVIISTYKPKIIINTVHGYLFSNKSVFFKKYILLLAEKILKSVTDVVITMNDEDYTIASKYKLAKYDIYNIHGMGVDFKSIVANNVNLLRSDIKLHDGDFVLIFVGEFSNRKNQQFLINAMVGLPDNIKLLLLGSGNQFDSCKQLSDSLSLSDRVFFVGYTKNISSYYMLSDICVSSSNSEGLPFNIIEAMYFKLPIVATNVKGHSDLIKNNHNGILFDINNIKEYHNAILALYKNKALKQKMGDNSQELSSIYDIDKVLYDNIQVLKNIFKKLENK